MFDNMIVVSVMQIVYEIINNFREVNEFFFDLIIIYKIFKILLFKFEMLVWIICNE